MLISEFDDLLHSKPFVPFDVVTADGRSLRVKSPEFAWHPPDSSRTVWVADGRGFAALIDLHHVTQVVLGGRENGKASKKSRH